MIQTSSAAAVTTQMPTQAGQAPQGEQQPGAEQAPGYLVHLDNFEGPLDLLLHLIKQDEIEIWEISISRITKQYQSYLESMEALNVEVAGEFLVMAAALMRIKSKRLLPRPPVLDGDEDEPQTEEELIQRLITYRMFKESAAHLKKRLEEAGPRFSRGLKLQLPGDYEYPLQEVDLFMLAEALRGVESRRRDQEQAVHEVQLEDVRLEDQVTHLLERLGQAGGRISFSDLFSDDVRRLEVAVTLLAALEMAREQVLQLLQDQPFEEIWIQSRLVAEARATEPRAAVEDFMTALPPR